MITKRRFRRIQSHTIHNNNNPQRNNGERETSASVGVTEGHRWQMASPFARKDAKHQ